MKRLIVLLAIIGICFMGCATTQTGTTAPTWDQTATTAYELTGATFSTAKTVLDITCAAGAIDAATCTKYAGIYKQAQEAYVIAGTALQAAIAISDAAQKQTAIQAYNVALAQLAPLAAQVMAMVAELKAKAQ